MRPPCGCQSRYIYQFIISATRRLLQYHNSERMGGRGEEERAGEFPHCDNVWSMTSTHMSIHLKTLPSLAYLLVISTFNPKASSLYVRNCPVYIEQVLLDILTKVLLQFSPTMRGFPLIFFTFIFDVITRPWLVSPKRSHKTIHCFSIIQIISIRPTVFMLL